MAFNMVSAKFVLEGGLIFHRKRDCDIDQRGHCYVLYTIAELEIMTNILTDAIQIDEIEKITLSVEQ